MQRETMADLVAFLAVARERSFTRAAAKLGVSPSALSHTIRKLEERLGVRLLTRTSRSVSTTEPGERLLERVGPRFDEIADELAEITELRDKPAGTLRITTGDQPAESILLPALAKLLPLYPDLTVDLTVDNGFVDIVAERFDAGVRLGETLAQDMVAVRIGPDMQMAIAGSPGYLVTHGSPQSPDDLANHNCINLRHQAKGGVSVWDLEKDGRAVNVRVEGQLVVNDIAIVRQAAVDGLGLCYLPRDYLQAHIDAGELAPVLEDWCPPFPGYHLYYPSRRQQSAALVAFIAAVRYRR
ncbi:LysR family transcriptional regulator [Sphingopyxis sp. Root214]|uniref:LysR family transcriptional regulator n=1 Tax=unclassified Sphingopyxis TaxID=2614943 RepID=UPI0006F45A54|nr:MULTISPECIES: LysR family transcriptional regulator [unclassified Sphingopyxis]KQZ73055.1 LysR family transcriptional regulator [Sphingopyxis sp. Root154]KRC07202.1 LysR family transcriptional regulator [Sphingopyxis sp. Root214]